METTFARRMLRSLEPLVAMAFFAEEVSQEIEAIGVRPWPTGYVTARAWALGRTSPEALFAMFFNFAPGQIKRGIPECWDVASPEEIGAARDRGVTRAFHRLTDGGDLPDLGTMVSRLRRAVAACPAEGRPLFAAVAGAPWPDDDPLLAVWHGGNRLREHRGDGHVAVLTAEGLDGVEALVLHAGTGDVPKSTLLQTRRWTEEDWQAGCRRLEDRGLVKGEELTDDGRALRESIEQRTDLLAMAPWEALGEEAEELRSAVRAVSRLVVDRGGVPGRVGRNAEEQG